MSLNEGSSPKGTGGSLLFKNLRDWIAEKYGDIAKSFVEVLVTVCFTFIPFLLLSIPWTKSDGELETKALFDTFLGYWQSGEIVLPILGLCGAVTALLALNVGYFKWWTHAFVGICILIFTLGGGAALIGSDGFSEVLNSELIVIGFVCYLFLAIVWFYLISKIRITEPKTRISDHSARDILNEANVRRGRAGN